MSGPAAGVAAASMLARRTSVARAVTCDIGGTSTDVALIIDGTPTVTRDRCVGGRVVRVPAIAVDSIAIGGGSIIAVDDVGALSVGPRSAGARPGPACYGHGGDRPTITDAALACGLIGAGGGVAGLDLRLDLARMPCNASRPRSASRRPSWRGARSTSHRRRSRRRSGPLSLGAATTSANACSSPTAAVVRYMPVRSRFGSGSSELLVPRDGAGPVGARMLLGRGRRRHESVRTACRLTVARLEALERTADELARTEIQHLG